MKYKILYMWLAVIYSPDPAPMLFEPCSQLNRRICPSASSAAGGALVTAGLDGLVKLRTPTIRHAPHHGAVGRVGGSYDRVGGR